MYTEILKIIEGGLVKDRNKVMGYSKLLVDNLRKDGEESFANSIESILNKKVPNAAYLDSFVNTPVDGETRLSMIDIEMPNKEIDLILPLYVHEEIDEFVDSIKKRKKLIELGIDINTSLLLYGPPGTGKTSIAHLIAYKINLPIVIVRLDSLVSSLLGNTSKNLRKIFDFANNRPCVLFLDEFDAIAKARDDDKELGELKRVINSLLQNIDEFNKSNILIAATNHHELLDAAIWRRFPVRMEISNPSRNEIVKLVQKYIGVYKYNFVDNEKKINTVAKAMDGLSPADIKSIIINTLRKSIIKDESEIKYNNLILEIYLYKNHSLKNIEEAVKFLNEFGVQQRSIFKMLGIPIRQVSSILK